MIVTHSCVLGTKPHLLIMESIMKKMNLRLLALCCTLGITNQVFAASDTFLAPPSLASYFNF